MDQSNATLVATCSKNAFAIKPNAVKIHDSRYPTIFWHFFRPRLESVEFFFSMSIKFCKTQGLHFERRRRNCSFSLSFSLFLFRQIRASLHLTLKEF